MFRTKEKSLPFFGKMWQFMRSCRGVSEPESCRRRRSVRCGHIAAFLLTKGAMPKALCSLKRRNGIRARRGPSRVHQECEEVDACFTNLYLCSRLSLPCQSSFPFPAVCWILSSTGLPRSPTSCAPNLVRKV